MGNNSTASSSSSSSIGSLDGRLLGSPWSMWSLWSHMDDYMALMDSCPVEAGEWSWLAAKIFLLATALPANTGLLWLLLRGRRALTASEVLGLNVSVMDILYCLCLPLDLYSSLRETGPETQSAGAALLALNLFGCPLLLTCMCLERYAAAARPIAYMRLGGRGYRAALCGAAWLLTLGVALLSYFLQMLTVTLVLSATISLLFLLMLLCLLGLVGALRRGLSPGAPLKRRALRTVVAVMVPAVVAYAPLVALVPYASVILSKPLDQIRSDQCRVLGVLLLFPNLGLFIGPMFYLSRFRRFTCCPADRPGSRTRAG